MTEQSCIDHGLQVPWRPPLGVEDGVLEGTTVDDVGQADGLRVLQDGGQQTLSQADTETASDELGLRADG